LKLVVRVRVPSNIPGKLFRPPLAIGDRHGLVSGALVPEASIDEDRDPWPSKNQICSSTEVWQWRRVDQVPEPSTVQFSTEVELLWCVPLAGVLHSLRHRRRRSV
jgi:hypothetical protein